jgi:hypothetical protein
LRSASSAAVLGDVVIGILHVPSRPLLQRAQEQPAERVGRKWITVEQPRM